MSVVIHSGFYEMKSTRVIKINERHRAGETTMDGKDYLEVKKRKERSVIGVFSSEMHPITSSGTQLRESVCVTAEERVEAGGYANLLI